jgi:hypothetical protein
MNSLSAPPQRTSDAFLADPFRRIAEGIQQKVCFQSAPFANSQKGCVFAVTSEIFERTELHTLLVLMYRRVTNNNRGGRRFQTFYDEAKANTILRGGMNELKTAQDALENLRLNPRASAPLAERLRVLDAEWEGVKQYVAPGRIWRQPVSTFNASGAPFQKCAEKDYDTCVPPFQANPDRDMQVLWGAEGKYTMPAYSVTTMPYGTPVCGSAALGADPHGGTLKSCYARPVPKQSLMTQLKLDIQTANTNELQFAEAHVERLRNDIAAFQATNERERLADIAAREAIRVAEEARVLAERRAAEAAEAKAQADRRAAEEARVRQQQEEALANRRAAEAVEAKAQADRRAAEEARMRQQQEEAKTRADEKMRADRAKADAEAAKSARDAATAADLANRKRAEAEKATAELKAATEAKARAVEVARQAKASNEKLALLVLGAVAVGAYLYASNSK